VRKGKNEERLERGGKRKRKEDNSQVEKLKLQSTH
jgi:hypothetical protein